MIKRRISVSLMLISIFFSSNSCNIYKPFFGCQKATTTPSVPISTLLSYPDTINISGKQHSLSVIMSNIGEANSCVGSAIGLYTGSDSDFKYPKEYKFEYLWLINKNEVWETRALETFNNNRYDIRISGGPNWNGTDDLSIDLVARISDTQGKTYFLKSRGIKISTIIS